MSEETKETKTDKKFTMRDVVWVLVGVVIGILIGWGVFTTTLSSSVNSLNADNKSAITTTVDDTATDKAAVMLAGGSPSAPFPPTQKGAPAGHSLVVFLNTAIITQVYVSFYNTLKIFSQALESFWLKASCKT